MVLHICSFTRLHGNSSAKVETRSSGSNRRGWLKGLRCEHIAVLHIAKVGLPGNVYGLGILFPCHVHFIDVVGGIAL